jgi:hypothetical protein
MLAYQLEISDLRSRNKLAVFLKAFSEDGELLRFYLNQLNLRFGDLTVEISNSKTSVCSLSPVVLSAQGCLTSELLRFL